MDAHHPDKKGFIESTRDGRVRLWKANAGYVTRDGGFSVNANKAQAYAGPGEAIQMARALGFAILSW